jgi:lipopolysaccharide export system permease protein
MKILDRYITRHVFFGFAAAAALLLPLFTTLDLVGELDDVTPDGYRLSQAIEVVFMTLPRRIVELGPFIALLGGIAALGQLAATRELTVMRATGLSIARIGFTATLAGLALALAWAALDEWVASPLQQNGLELRNEAMSAGAQASNDQGSVWARQDDQIVRVGNLQHKRLPVNIEIFRFDDNRSLVSYIFAESADIQDAGQWRLNNVQIKQWDQGTETTQQLDHMVWHSIFGGARLGDITLPTESLSVRQLYRYITYLKDSGQPSAQYEMAMWQKLGRPILTLAMILFAIPFAFAQPRSPNMGARLALGALVGLMVYVSNQIIVNLGLLLKMNTLITTLGPALVLLAVAIGMVGYMDRGRR